MARKLMGATFLVWLVLSTMTLRVWAGKDVGPRHGLDFVGPAKPYRSMPATENGPFPQHLSETGIFSDVRAMVIAEGLIPYDLNVTFFSDGAYKSRWMSPAAIGIGVDSKIGFSATSEWKFPAGTVFVKHFDFATDETRPEVHRRLETRLLVCNKNGSVYGVSYKWRSDNSDADLLLTNLLENIPIRTSAGVRTQQWYYPSRKDCRTCHTDLAGGVLGVKTRQLNRDKIYPGGVVDNQLRVWSHLGLFDRGISDDEISRYPRLSDARALDRPLVERARSYLDANCSHCHRPGGTVANFDARYETSLEEQNLIGGPVLIDQGIDKARVIAPNDIWRSIIYARVSNVDSIRMPPLAHEMVDVEGVKLLRAWIESMPGPPVLPPPTFSVGSGRKGSVVQVRLNHPEAGVVIHYTVDGTAPTAADPVFEHALELAGPTMVRARAYKPGFTKSIPIQQLFGETN